MREDVCGDRDRGEERRGGEVRLVSETRDKRW